MNKLEVLQKAIKQYINEQDAQARVALKQQIDMLAMLCAHEMDDSVQASYKAFESKAQEALNEAKALLQQLNARAKQ